MRAPPTTLPTPVDAVTARLARQGLVIRSVWFPSTSEAENWRSSGVPLYVRPLSTHALELGPRLENMWASVFSPVLVGTLTDAASGCEVQWSRRPVRLTSGILATWVALLVAWPVTMVVSGDVGGFWFWLLLAASTISAPIVGWVRGGQALDDGIPWLEAILLAEDEEEDW